MKVERAIISVWDKTGIVPFAEGLSRRGIEILSTGGTAKLLRGSKIPVIEISDFTGFPEIMDGRVKTLHPKIYAGLLCIRGNPSHEEQAQKLGIKMIDMVVVNLYPFQETIAREGCTLEEAIENIDIGGPTMIRAAAKNYKHVAVVTNPARYGEILEALAANNGGLPDKLLFDLAREAFRLTSHYDHVISNYLEELSGEEFPSSLSLELEKAFALRYGENPHQKAAFYRRRGTSEPSVSTGKLLSGKELSFNNILDANAALEIVKEFEKPAVSIIKHTNPCGAGCAETMREAIARALVGDPVSAFGGIVAFNRVLDVEAASSLAACDFFEVIVGPGYTPEALRVLQEKPKWGKSVRIIEVGELSRKRIDLSERDVRSVVGGFLIQTRDLSLWSPDGYKVVTKRKPTDEEMRDLTFAWVIAKHVKSNAIVIAKDETVLGVGAGQMSRVDSTEIAVKKAGSKSRGAVLASDAFFPFVDAVKKAADAGITAFIHPGGGMRDEEVIAFVNERGLAMVLTGQRHFKH